MSKLSNATVVSNAIYDHPEIDSYDIAVYVTICKFRGKDGKAFPSVDTIARLVKLSEKKVRMVIAKLSSDEFGFITKEKSGKHNVYTINHDVYAAQNDIPESHTDKQTVCSSFINNSLSQDINKQTDITSAVRDDLDCEGIAVDDTEIAFAVSESQSRTGVKSLVKYAVGIVKKRIEQGKALVSNRTIIDGFGESNTRSNDYYSNAFYAAWAQPSIQTAS